jgi:hypothetical protein
VVATTAAVAAAPLQFTEAELFFELNHTDGDLGIHASIDGGPYVKLEIEDPAGQRIFSLGAQGRLAKQGLTQLFLESAEPPFDELPPATFFLRFPEGWYEIEGTTSTGREFSARVRLSHVMAAPPSDVMVNGLVAAESCDADPLPTVAPPVTITWSQVTASHPTIGEQGPVQISRYQFFVEQEPVKLAVDLSPSTTSFEVPEAITAAGGEFKFEIIARTTTGNNTAIESCFVVE